MLSLRVGLTKTLTGAEWMEGVREVLLTQSSL